VPEQESYELMAGSGSVVVNSATGAIDAITLAGRQFVAGGARTSGLVRLAVPTPDYPSHFLEVGTHGAPAVRRVDEGLRLTYDGLSSRWGSLAVRVQVDLRPSPQGLSIRVRLDNHSDQTIPQVAFPQLLGLEAVGGIEETRLQLARRRIVPFRELAMRPDDAWWLNRRLQVSIPYGLKDFNMKWLDYGDGRGGLTAYSTNTRATAQGLVLDRQDRDSELLDVRWVHYPYTAPGESWDSGEFVLLLHDGDWYAGARAFAEFAREAYPYHAPRHIREALAIRSVWPAVRNSPPTFGFDELHTYAEELTDPNLGVGELVLWHWWLKNGLPIIIDERLGSRADLEAALSRCAELGVPVSMFVSHNLVRVSEETDPDWRHINAGGLAVEDNWTYGPDFLPRFRVPFMGTHAMVRATPLSRGWRETALAEYAKLLDYGGTSICFDVFQAPIDPEYSPAADGRPDEAGVRLIEFAAAARELIHQRDPEGSFSGEFISDTKMPILDYTWEWTNAYEIADAGPFRYVFPQFRLNANVGTHPRGALIAFMEGALLNLIPGDMRSHHLADHPALVAVVTQLAALRRRFLPYFTEGQFRATEGLTVVGADARAYSHGDGVVVIAINPTDHPVAVSLAVDPASWGGVERTRAATVHRLDGTVELPPSPGAGGDRVAVELGPDDLCVVEFLP